jgi:hypothetical protein
MQIQYAGPKTVDSGTASEVDSCGSKRSFFNNGENWRKRGFRHSPSSPVQRFLSGALGTRATSVGGPPKAMYAHIARTAALMPALHRVCDVRKMGASWVCVLRRQ